MGSYIIATTSEFISNPIVHAIEDEEYEYSLRWVDVDDTTIVAADCYINNEFLVNITILWSRK